MPFISIVKRTTRKKNVLEQFDTQSKKTCKIPLLCDVVGQRTYEFEEQREDSDTTFQPMLDERPGLQVYEEKNFNLDMWYGPNIESNSQQNVEDTKINTNPTDCFDDHSFRKFLLDTEEDVSKSASAKSCTSRESTDKSMSRVQRFESFSLDGNDIFSESKTSLSNSHFSQEHPSTLPNVIICNAFDDETRKSQTSQDSASVNIGHPISSENTIDHFKPIELQPPVEMINNENVSSNKLRHLNRLERHKILNNIRRQKQQIIQMMYQDEVIDETSRSQTIGLSETIATDSTRECSGENQLTASDKCIDKPIPDFNKKRNVKAIYNDESKFSSQDGDNLTSPSDTSLGNTIESEKNHYDKIDSILSKELIESIKKINSADSYLLDHMRKLKSKAHVEKWNDFFLSLKVSSENDMLEPRVILDDNECSSEVNDTFSDDEDITYQNRLTDQELLELNKNWNKIIEESGMENILSKERHIIWWDEKDSMVDQLNTSEDLPKNSTTYNPLREKLNAWETATSLLDSFFQNFVWEEHACLGSEIQSVNSRSSF